jgi:hypothetical protein
VVQAVQLIKIRMASRRMGSSSRPRFDRSSAIHSSATARSRTAAPLPYFHPCPQTFYGSSSIATADRCGSVAHALHCSNKLFISAEIFLHIIAQIPLIPNKKLSNVQYLRTINEKKLRSGKFTAYNSPITAELAFAMTTLHIRSLLAIAVTALLAACGGTDVQSNTPTQTAALVQSSAAQAAPLGTSSAAAQAAAAQAPQPDCAPEGCKGLRIIDGNAEAYRVEAMRRAADEANAAQPS